MELIIALFCGAVGGSLICGVFPKISVSLWLSIFGGMIGGGAVFLAVSKLLALDKAKISETADINSLLILMAIGMIGGILALSPICLKRWRKVR